MESVKSPTPCTFGFLRQGDYGKRKKYQTRGSIFKQICFLPLLHSSSANMPVNELIGGNDRSNVRSYASSAERTRREHFGFATMSDHTKPWFTELHSFIQGKKKHTMWPMRPIKTAQIRIWNELLLSNVSGHCQRQSTGLFSDLIHRGYSMFPASLNQYDTGNHNLPLTDKENLRLEIAAVGFIVAFDPCENCGFLVSWKSTTKYFPWILAQTLRWACFDHAFSSYKAASHDHSSSGVFTHMNHCRKWFLSLLNTRRETINKVRQWSN